MCARQVGGPTWRYLRAQAANQRQRAGGRRRACAQRITRPVAHRMNVHPEWNARKNRQRRSSKRMVRREAAQQPVKVQVSAQRERYAARSYAVRRKARCV